MFSVDFGIDWVRSAIGLKKSRHFFNQSEMEPAPIVTRSHIFPRFAIIIIIVIIIIIIIIINF